MQFIQKITIFIIVAIIETVSISNSYAKQCSNIELKSKHIKCNKNSCEAEDTTAYLCKKQSPSTFIKANKTTIYKDRKINLINPVLHINDLPVLGLPFLTLLPPDKIGLLPPKLQWSKESGLNAGPSLYIPLNKHMFTTSTVAIRTSEGMDATLGIYSTKGYLKVTYLLLNMTNHGVIEFKTTSPFKNAQASAKGTLSTDKKSYNSLTFLSKKRAVTHQESRVLLYTGNSSALFSSYGYFSKNFTPLLIDETADNSFFKNYNSNFQLSSKLSKPLFDGIIQPDLTFSFKRTFTDSPNLFTCGTRFDLRPLIQIPVKIKIFKFTYSAASIHKIWLLDNSQKQIPFNSISSTLYGELPLEKKYTHLKHSMSFITAWSITPAAWGSHPSVPSDLMDLIDKGQTINSLIKNRFTNNSNNNFNIDVGYFTILKTFNQNRQNIFTLNSILNTSHFSFAAQTFWKHKKRHPSVINIMLKLKNFSGSNFSTGITYMDSQLNTTGINNLQMTKWFYTQSNNLKNSLLLYKNFLKIPITSFLSANANYQINLINPVHLNLLRYGLKLNGPCKCMELELMISHRVKLQNAAVMLSLNINKF